MAVLHIENTMVLLYKYHKFVASKCICNKVNKKQWTVTWLGISSQYHFEINKMSY